MMSPPVYFTELAPRSLCVCGKDRRANAVTCRDCWLSLPTSLRFALPSKPGPDRERIAKLIVEFVELQSRIAPISRAANSRGRYARDTFKRKHAASLRRLDEILKEALRAGVA